MNRLRLSQVVFVASVIVLAAYWLINRQATIETGSSSSSDIVEPEVSVSTDAPTTVPTEGHIATNTPASQVNYNFDPLNLISIHYLQTENRNRDSRYLLAQILEICGRSHDSLADFEQTMSKHTNMPEYLEKRARLRFTTCLPARKKHTEFFNSAPYNSDTSLRDEHPLHLLKFRKLSLEDRKKYIREVLSSKMLDPLFKGEAIQAAVTIYSQYPGYEDDYRAELLQFVACKYEPLCDTSEYAELAKQFYPPSKYEEFINQANLLDSQIMNGDFSGLGI